MFISNMQNATEEYELLQHVSILVHNLDNVSCLFHLILNNY